MRIATFLALTSISSTALAGTLPPPQGVPEPGMWALLGVGALVGLIAAGKRK